MKRFIKLSLIPLFLLSIVSIDNQVHAGMAAPGMAAPAMSSDSRATFNPGGQAAIPSVHEMFKDVPQDELLQMMEEGQQFIKYLEENGTPEEKMAFAQAMEETLQGFTEDDWKEFEQIVETVQDKLPPLVIEPKEEVIAEPAKQETPKEEVKAVAIDNSLGKVLHDIHKAINALLLKAKSDKVLTERITIAWDNKDNFNEMDRLLQSLNTKDHIIKLTTSKDEAIKGLLESIQNFNTRLQMENDKFIIADTFGLQADEQTTAANLKKLNKILEFFDSAIESLLPKLVKFIAEYEPEALKMAKAHDDNAKKALDHATKVEKQKRPIGSSSYNDRSPSYGSQNNYNQSQYSINGAHGGQAAHRQQTPDYLEQVHNENLRQLQSKKSSQGGSSSDASADKAGVEGKKEGKETNGAYISAIDSLESYLESNGNTEVKNYMATVGKTGGIYTAFGTPLDENETTRFAKLKEKRSSSHQLNPEESRFVQRYEEQWQAADKNFDRNTQAAHTYYSNLSDSIATISPQIDEMSHVLQSVKSSLTQMNSTELEKLNTSPVLKDFAQRINNYHTSFKRVQTELKNKHKLHRLEGKDASETRSYDELANKVENLHGLDRRISDVKSLLESLHKAIKSAIGRKKREEHKAAHNK